VGGLGTRFDSLIPTIKRYPGCGATQQVVDGTLELAREHHIRVEDVTRVVLRVGEASYRLCGEKKGKPPNSAEALWNHRYSTAVALVKGKVFVDDFTEEAIRDTRVLDLLQKVEVEPDESLRHDVNVEIETRDGKSCRQFVDHMNPMSEVEIIEKFRKCNTFSEKPLPEESVEGFIRMVMKLEEIDDITKVIRMLSSS